jgi:hypothetical protein
MTIPDKTEPNVTTDEKTYCAVHPTVETSLRCNRCGRYMCVRCAVPTPVGYRCRQCVYQQQDAFYKATQRDYLVAAGVAFGLSLPIGFIIPRIFLLGVLLLSFPAGALIGEAVLRSVGRRRGRYLWAVVVGCILLGALITNFPLFQDIFATLNMLGSVRGGGQLVLQVIIGQALPPLLYMVMCCLVAALQLR